MEHCAPSFYCLKEWKKYRVLLNRVDTSIAPNIEWPEKPTNQAIGG